MESEQLEHSGSRVLAQSCTANATSCHCHLLSGALSRHLHVWMAAEAGTLEDTKETNLCGKQKHTLNSIFLIC